MSLLILLLIPFIGAFVSLYLGTLNETLRDWFNGLSTLITLLWIAVLFKDVQQESLTFFLPNVMGTGLYLKMDMLRYYLIALTGAVWCIVMLYSSFYLTRHKNRNRYYFCYLLTCSFTFGIFLSDNLLNVFTFFEAMTFSSYILVIHDEDDFSHGAGISYLAMAITGGLVMLMGILVAFDYTNTLLISELIVRIRLLDPDVQRLIGGLIAVGFGVKSSMFPLHTWITRVYVAAPTPATAVLSGVLLKTGLYGMYLAAVVLTSDPFISYGILILGTVNMLLGGFLAMNQRNVKRIIAYSSMSQAGFMIVGIGLIGILQSHAGIAFLGTVFFMINHAISKVLLFLIIGVLYHWIKELSLTQIWGFGKNQIVLKGLFFIAILGTIGFPGFNGFISKSLIHEAIVEGQQMIHLNFFFALEGCFFLASAMTVAYMLKLGIALFVSTNQIYATRPKDPLTFKGIFPIILLGAITLLFGVYYEQILDPILHFANQSGFEIAHTPDFYTWENILYTLLILLAGTGIYLFYIRKELVKERYGQRIFLNQTLNWLNLENHVYVPFLLFCFKWLSKFLSFVDSWMLKIKITLLYFYASLINIDSKFLKRLEWDRQTIDVSTQLDAYEISDDLSLHSKTYTLGESISQFYFNITSINYTVLFVASMLVLLMAILLLIR